MDLGGVSYGVAHDINDAGVAAGVGATGPPVSGGPGRPFLWTAVGVATDLGTLGGPDGYALGLNELQWVTGSADRIAHEVGRAFVWSPTSGMQEINHGQLANYSWGAAIDESGRCNGNDCAAKWRDSHVRA